MSKSSNTDLSIHRHYLDESPESLNSPINLSEEVLQLNEDSSKGGIPIPALEEELTLEIRDLFMA